MVELFVVNTGETVTWSYVSRANLSRLILISESGEIVDASGTSFPAGRIFAFDTGGAHLEDPRETAWVDFSDYPSGSWYDSPFPFSDYEDFSGKYRQIPMIDTQLHKNQTSAKQSFARLTLATARLECVIHVAEKRLLAASALLKSAVGYEKDCNSRLKLVLERFPKDEIPHWDSALISPFENHQFLPLLSKAKTDQYLSLLNMKKHVKSVKDQLGKTQKIIETRTGLQAKSARKLMNRVNFAHLEETKTVFLSMREIYTRFRDVLAEVMDTNKVVQNRSEKARSLLSLESQFSMWKTELEKAEKHAKDVETVVAEALKESQQSHQGLNQAVSVVGYCTKMLKVKFEFKLGKATSRLLELQRKMQILDLPAKIDLFESAKTAEICTRKLSLDRLAEEKDNLMIKIKLEEENRRKFMTDYGHLVPENCFPGLKKAETRRIPEIFSQSKSFLSRKAIIEAAFEEKRRKMTENIQEIAAETLVLADSLQKQRCANLALERELKNCLETKNPSDLNSAQEAIFQSFRCRMCT